FESQKTAEAGKLFEEVATQARSRPVGAEAALRAGQCRIAEGQQKIAAGKQERGRPNLRPEQAAAADRVINDGRGVVAQAAARLAGGEEGLPGGALAVRGSRGERQVAVPAAGALPGRGVPVRGRGLRQGGGEARPLPRPRGVPERPRGERPGGGPARAVLS